MPLNKQETKIVKIGSSWGIRIPKSFIEQTGIENEVELEVKGNAIVIKPISEVRKNWEAAFRKMGENKDDVLPNRDALNTQLSVDEDEWNW